MKRVQPLFSLRRVDTPQTAATSRQTAIIFFLVLSVFDAGSAYSQPLQGPTCSSEEFELFLANLAPVEGRISLTMAPNKTRWRVGESATVSVVSPFGGELLLLSVDSMGTVFPLYPLPNSDGLGEPGEIKASTPVVLPPNGMEYVMQAPEGSSRLVAIVHPKGRNLPLRCAQAVVRDLEKRPRSSSVEAEQQPLPKVLDGWGYATFSYAIGASGSNR